MKPSSSINLIHCDHCDNAVDTPEEHASYPDGQCPECKNPWTGAERTGVRIFATVPEAADGQA
jgi:uncharacterized paraquat-inducible protein A